MRSAPRLCASPALHGGSPPRSSLSMARRRLLSSSAAADERGTFSSTWRSVDTNTHSDQPSTLTPDPIDYLRGFDASSATKPYRAALLAACTRSMQPGFAALDVGCGIGGNTAGLCRSVGPTGRVLGIDIADRAIAAARERHAAASPPPTAATPQFRVADVFSLSNELPAGTAEGNDADGRYDVVLEDRVLQHLVCPVDAVREMVQMTKPGGTVVCGNPDWRSFQIDVTAAGAGGADSGVGGVAAEAGRRWGEHRRPPAEHAFDWGDLTARMLNGAIPRLAAHSYVGLAMPRLLRAAGLQDVALEVVPLLFRGRAELEAVVPITYFARVLAVNHGALTEQEAEQWLGRLQWEQEERLFGVLNMYVCSGTVPPLLRCDDRSQDLTAAVSVSSTTSSVRRDDKSHELITAARGRQRRLPRIRQLQPEDVTLAPAIADLINKAYSMSDTGITLSTQRIPVPEVSGMIRGGEIWAALDGSDNGSAGWSENPVGCVQVLIKHDDGAPGPQTPEVDERAVQNAGLPSTHSNSGPAGEFTCLAVAESFAGRGLGEALIRAAEAHARRKGCETMRLGVMCPNVPPESEPDYKVWLQRYYLRLGYDHLESLELRFKPPLRAGDHNEEDQLHEMYECLRQLVPCKAILMDKAL